MQRLATDAKGRSPITRNHEPQTPQQNNLLQEKLDELRRKEELKEARRREEMESRAAAMRKTPLKPASANPVAANSGVSPRKEPLRVSSQHLMSVKTQIRLLKHIQAAEKKSTQTVHRTKFRRAKDDAPDEEEAKPSTSGGDLWSGLKEPPLFLVDGYNIIGLWPKLKKKKNQDDMDGARMLLQQELMQFASYRCVAVYPGFDRRNFGTQPTQIPQITSNTIPCIVCLLNAEPDAAGGAL